MIVSMSHGIANPTSCLCPAISTTATRIPTGSRLEYELECQIEPKDLMICRKLLNQVLLNGTSDTIVRVPRRKPGIHPPPGDGIPPSGLACGGLFGAVHKPAAAPSESRAGIELVHQWYDLPPPLAAVSWHDSDRTRRAPAPRVSAPRVSAPR